MTVGFIGTGSMGTVLIESFIRSGALQPNEIAASNRTRSKAEQLADKLGVRVADSNKHIAESCEIVFLCIKPGEFIKVIEEIKSSVRSEQIIVSITSPVLLENLEKHLIAKIAKVIPSITNYMLSGPTLCMYGNAMQHADIARLEELLAYISHPLRVAESFTRISSDIASCGPAFFAFLLQQFIDAAVAETGIDPVAASRMATEMLLGTGMLLTSGGMSPEALQGRVAVPGGITAEGLRLLQKETGDVFRQLIHITHAKYNEDVEKINAAFAQLPE